MIVLYLIYACLALLILPIVYLGLRENSSLLLKVLLVLLAINSLFAIYYILVIEAFGKKILVSDDGISYTYIKKRIPIKIASIKGEYFLRWVLIQSVYIGSTARGLRGARIDALIFSIKPIDTLLVNEENIGEDFIFMTNINMKVIQEIRKHWRGEIRRMDSLPKRLRY